MKETKKEYLKQWLDKAEHDKMAARLILDQQPLILGVACFHCQQAVEKLLKVFLISQNKEFPKTHNPDLLLQHSCALDHDFLSIEIGNLEDFAVRGRYPHDFLQPTEVETEAFFQTVLFG